MAGYDTSNAAISWTLGLIAAHDDVQRKVASELHSLGLRASSSQPQPRRLTWDDLSHLDYLRKVIKVMHIASVSVSSSCFLFLPFDPAMPSDKWALD